MKLGIDISLLQTAHRRRGIGYTLINFINHLPKEARAKHSFVFYHFPIEQDNNPFDLLRLDGVTYRAEEIDTFSLKDTGNRGRSGLVLGAMNQFKTLRDIVLGDSRIKDLGAIEHFLQFDQNQPLPYKRGVKSTLVVYDLIPYVMEADYLWSYKTARARGRSRKNSLRLAAKRKFYKLKTRMIANKASRVMAISEHTKQDFVNYLGVNSKKIQVCLLGVDNKVVSAGGNSLQFNRYIPTGWGPIPKKVVLSDEKFLLFVGGADQRRRLSDLLAAFNNLRAQGHDVKLILAGDTMQGIHTTPIYELNDYFKNTSYLEDVYFLGFVSDQQRDWLYGHALAFVYPSLYEGFGLPILEAMRYGTPVITYKNSSIYEVAGDAAIYAHDALSIKDACLELISNPKKEYYKNQGKQQAAKFSWEKTVAAMLGKLMV